MYIATLMVKIAVLKICTEKPGTDYCWVGSSANTLLSANWHSHRKAHKNQYKPLPNKTHWVGLFWKKWVLGIDDLICLHRMVTRCLVEVLITCVCVVVIVEGGTPPAASTAGLTTPPAGSAAQGVCWKAWCDIISSVHFSLICSSVQGFQIRN